MKKLLFAAALAVLIPLKAQAQGGPIYSFFNGAPTGPCESRQLGQNLLTGALYTCPSGSWVAITTATAIFGAPSTTQPQVAVNVPSGGAASLQFQNKLIVDLRDATYAGGAKCNGGDDTAALNAGLTAVYNAGGGTLVMPTGTCTFSSAQINIPNDGLTTPSHPPIRITSYGNSSMASAAAGVITPNGGSIMNMTFNAATAKIVDLGVGYLEIDHVTLEDTGSDCAPFIFTTNPVSQFYFNEFYGTAFGTSACNVGIILGGTGSSVGGSTTSEFQGYGTIVFGNFFNQMSTAIRLVNQVNGQNFLYNTVWNRGGTSSGGAFEITGGTSDTGNHFIGNLIEITNYKYGFWFNCTCVNNTLSDNTMFDFSATNTTGYRFESGAQFNRVDDSYNSNATTPIQDVSNTNTYNAIAQNVVSQIRNPIAISDSSAGPGMSIAAGSGVSEYLLKNNANSDSFYWTANGTGLLNMFVNIAGGGAVNDWQWHYYGANQYSLECLGTTFCGFETPNVNMSLRTKSGGTGTLTDLSNANALQWNGGNVTITNQATSPSYLTSTNCASSGGTCTAAIAGQVSIAAAATTVTVTTTKVTANSEIFIQEDSSLGTRLSVTCNTTTGRTYTVTTRTAATSFVITASGAPTTNPACLSYWIVN